ncbi:ABC transporter ATP-binding protein [Dermabacteraceae bacterium TAE3-ERU27]|nr:ABC transporter ATP-binding protein [Dermabacteraceae bacterium TAE3-ERU27]
MNEIAISARNLVKTYGSGEAAVRAVDDISLDITQGTFTSIMGPSGSGKSTLMHLLAGLDSLDSGSIVISGTDISTLSDNALTKFRRDNIGFIFQRFNLLPMLSAKQNILLPLDLAGRKPQRGKLEELAATLGLTERLGHLPSQLSGGQIQRVAIARALITSPSVIFADEPTGNLDTASGSEVLRLLRMAVDELGQTVVMVTHEPDAAAVGDRVLTLVDGKIDQDAGTAR